MRRLSPRGRRIAVAATILGTALLLVGGYRTLVNDSSAPDSSAGSTPGIPLPLDSPEDTPSPSEDVVDPDGTDDQPGWGTSAGGNSFTDVPRNDQIHDVTITLRSDGPMKYMYRFHTGDIGPKDANRSASITKKLRGPRAVAQVFVQVLGSSSYATCTMSIDGEIVSTTTARTTYQVVACTG